MTAADAKTPTEARTKDSLKLAIPNGWTSWIGPRDKVINQLAGAIGGRASDIKNVIEEKHSDEYVFSCKKALGPEVLYLFGLGSGDTHQIVSPSTQKELWAVLGNRNWLDCVKLQAV